MKRPTQFDAGDEGRAALLVRSIYPLVRSTAAIPSSRPAFSENSFALSRDALPLSAQAGRLACHYDSPVQVNTLSHC